MSTFVSAGSQQGTTIRVAGNSLNYLSAGSSASSEVKKNPLLQEVDAELRKLRDQFNSVTKVDSGYNRTVNPEEQRSYGITQQGVSNSSSSSNINRYGVNSSFNSGAADSSYAGRVNQSFEIKRDVNQNQMDRNKASTGLQQYQQPVETTSQQPTYSTNVLYDPRNRWDSATNSANMRSLTPVVGARTINSSFEVRRMGESESRAAEASYETRDRQNSGSNAYGTREPSNTATVNRVEPTRFEVKKVEPVAPAQTGYSFGNGLSANTAKPSTASPALDYSSSYQPAAYGGSNSTTSTNSYSTPTNTYSTPANTYNTPTNTYSTPNNTYGSYPNNNSYGSNNYTASNSYNKDTYNGYSSYNEASNNVPVTAPQPVNEFAKLRMKTEEPVQAPSVETPTYESIRRSQMMETQKPMTAEPSRAQSQSLTSVGGDLSRSRTREVPANAVPVIGDYEPSKLPEPNRGESQKQQIKIDSDNLSQYSRDDSIKGSPASEKYSESSPERRQREEEIRRNEAKRQAEQSEKINVLTKNIDTVNRENAGLKHEITKLNNEVKKMDTMKQDVEDMRNLIQEKDEALRQMTLLKEEADIKAGRLEEELNETRRSNIGQMMPVVSGAGFDVALKHQLEENIRTKERMSDKDAEIDRLRDQIIALRMESNEFKREVDIQRVKHMAELNNLQTNQEIEIQRLESENESLQKVVGSLDEKLKFLLKEDKKKDEFLMNYLKGKANNPEDKDLVVNFFRQFEQVPKLSISELMKQQKQMSEQLREEIKRLEVLLDVERVASEEVRKRYANIRFL